jgi:hypothetical protein
MHSDAHANLRGDANTALGLNLVDVEHFGVVEDTEMHCFPGLRPQPDKARTGTLAQIKTADREAAELEEFQSKTVTAMKRALIHHAMALENHQKAMYSALVKADGSSKFTKAHFTAGLREYSHDRNRTIQNLNFIRALVVPE